MSKGKLPGTLSPGKDSYSFSNTFAARNCMFKLAVLNQSLTILTTENKKGTLGCLFSVSAVVAD